MSERTIFVFAKSGVTITHADGSPTTQGDVIGNALNGDAFSWENPNDLTITLPGETVAITFEDSDGLLTDDPFSGSEVIDQRLSDPVTINGTTYSPSGSTTRWQWPAPVNVENEWEVTLYDDAGNAYRMVGVSITQGYTTDVVGVMFDGASPPPGTTLHYYQGVSSYSGAGQSVPISDEVPCFRAGTLIETAAGPRPVEALRPGDRVLTRDRGLQPVRWAGHSLASGGGALAPVRIVAGALGNTRDLWVSPNHRILLNSQAAELYFGQNEVLVPAKALVDGRAVQRVAQPRVAYFHLLLDGHEMVYSEGIASESLFAGPMALQALGAAARRDLRAHYPDIDRAAWHLNRPGLSVAETRLILPLDRRDGVRLPGAGLAGARAAALRAA
ncbi:Hint domain-containing protein [Sinisalibacter aestuarii]|uniref:Hedgehog/Intein (Hint) domain-containing protein n=1 Tax=Sinisalibacter aestuarii TaxID=2949426 RepID=A0ABQ5LQF8_9RHOB|nr:Hint domain-containing protein [Sinisalibacter aestuarii]GKY87239.1 hypothetical protein STA1M1_11080 [Sinisalibacter aestuarii]